MSFTPEISPSEPTETPCDPVHCKFLTTIFVLSTQSKISWSSDSGSEILLIPLTWFEADTIIAVVDNGVTDGNAVRTIRIPAISFPHVGRGIRDGVYGYMLIDYVLRLLNQVCPFRCSAKCRKRKYSVGHEKHLNLTC
jgi:hypothetical protein